MRMTCAMICSLLLAISMSPQGLAACDCSKLLTNDVKYSSIASEDAFPEPIVVRTLIRGNDQTIWVSYTLLMPNDNTSRHAVVSEDGGKTWKSDPGYRDAGLMGSATKSIAYRYNGNDLLQRSLDGGNHWTDCKFDIDGLTAQAFTRKVANSKAATLHFGLSAVHPRDPGTIYGVISVWVPSSSDRNVQTRIYDLPGLYVSRNGGDNWTMFAPNLKGSSPDEMPVLGIDPSNPERMLGHATAGVVMTTDGGRSWKPIGQQAALEAPAEIEGRREAIAARGPDGESIPLHPEFTHLVVYQFGFDSTHSSIIYLVTNKGLYKSEDAAHSWCLLDLDKDKPKLSEVRSLSFDAPNSSRLFVGTRNKVMVSDDGGCVSAGVKIPKVPVEKSPLLAW